MTGKALISRMFGLAAMLLASLAASLPVAAQVSQPASSGIPWAWAWIGLLLVLVAGIAAGWMSGAGERRESLRLGIQLDECSAELQRQARQLLAASRERDEFAAQLEQQSLEFARQAHEDGLTALPNGRAFDEHLAQNFSRSKRHGQPLSLLLLDLDHLRQINESWSHAMGDGVLIETAKLLRAVSRTSDLPARLGGDLFALVLTDTNQEGAWTLSQRLHSAFARHGQWYAGDVGPNYVTFSAGLVTLGDQDEAPAQLFQRADRALYLAKHAGGARTTLG